MGQPLWANRTVGILTEIRTLTYWLYKRVVNSRCTRLFSPAALTAAQVGPEPSLPVPGAGGPQGAGRIAREPLAACAPSGGRACSRGIRGHATAVPCPIPIPP